jgi:hypothetical protein
MRFVCRLVALSLLATGSIFTASQAQAETKVFIIANESDGYGVDLCLARGESCGMPAARSYCQSRQFSTAAGFRRLDTSEVTGAIPHGEMACHGGSCGEFVAITCQR